MTFYSEKGRENHPNSQLLLTPWFFRGVGIPPTRYVSLQWLLVKVTDPHGFGSNPTFLWVESHHFMKHSSSHHQFWVNSELHMWNLNGSTSLLKNHIFVSEIASFHSKITIVHGYPSFSSWNHIGFMCSIRILQVKSPFFVGETSVKPPFFHGFHIRRRRKTTPSWPRTSLRDWERWRASGWCDKLIINNLRWELFYICIIMYMYTQLIYWTLLISIDMYWYVLICIDMY